jgi:hypothetical protein
MAPQNRLTCLHKQAKRSSVLHPLQPLSPVPLAASHLLCTVLYMPQYST